MASTLNTQQLWKVRRSLPIFPGIFLPFQMRPGSLRQPMAPGLRWTRETPWDAPMPENPHFFMTPAKQHSIRA